MTTMFTPPEYINEPTRTYIHGCRYYRNCDCEINIGVAIHYLNPPTNRRFAFRATKPSDSRCGRCNCDEVDTDFTLRSATGSAAEKWLQVADAAGYLGIRLAMLDIAIASHYRG
jgi:hypothetical protein